MFLCYKFQILMQTKLSNRFPSTFIENYHNRRCLLQAFFFATFRSAESASELP